MTITINTVSPVVLNNQQDTTSDFQLDSNGNRLYYDVCTLSLQTPIVLSNCEVKLETLAIFNSWDAISAANGNNVFQIIFDNVSIGGTTTTQVIFSITIPDGTYNISDLNDVLTNAQISYGLYFYQCEPPQTVGGPALVTDTVVVPLTMVASGTRSEVLLKCAPWGIPYKYSPPRMSPTATVASNFYNYITPLGWANSNFPATPPTLDTYWANATTNQILTNCVTVTTHDFSTVITPCSNSKPPRFRIPTGFGKIIGFAPGDYPPTVPTGPYSMYYNDATDVTVVPSTMPPQVSLYNTIIVECNLVRDVINPYYSNFLYDITTDAPPGGLVRATNLATFRKAQDGTYDQIQVKLITQNNQPLPIRDPNRNFSITIQPVEGNSLGVGNPGTTRDSIGYSPNQPNQSPLVIEEDVNQQNIENLTGRGRHPTFPRDLQQFRLKPISRGQNAEYQTGGSIKRMRPN